MTAEIKTIVSQLNLVGGAWRDEAPNQVAVREPKSTDVPGAGKGDLFVLTELFGSVANRAVIEQQIAQTIRDNYYPARGAVTASLRRALQAANDQLYQHNQKVKPSRRITAGAIVVVIRGEEAFIAQIGPTSLFAVLNDLIRRYPIQSSRPDKRQPTKLELGAEVLAEPNLHHLHLEPGDTLILADSHLASRLSLDDVVKTVIMGNAKATVKSLVKAAHMPDCSALVLTAIAAEQSALAALKRNAPAPLGRLLGRGQDQAIGYQSATTAKAPTADVVADTPPPPAHIAVGRVSQTPRQKLLPRLGRFAKKPKHAKTEPLAKPPATRPTASKPARPQKEPPNFEVLEFEKDDEPAIHSREQAREMASVAHDPDFHSKLRGQSQATTPAISVGRMLRWIGAGLLLLIALLGNGLKTILGLILPGAHNSTPRRAGAHVYQEQVSSLSWKLLRNIVIAIPIVIGLIVAISYIQKGRIREAEYQEFIITAQNKYQQAQAVASDPVTALGLMAEAETRLIEAETIKANQPEIIELRAQMQATADSITQVERLIDLPQLRQYTDGGANLKNIVVQGVEVYVLDSGADRIFHHQLDDTGRALLPDDESLLLTAREQQVETITVGELLGMTWMPAGGNRQTSDLIILNSTGLLEFNPNWGITTSVLASGELLALPVAVSSYFGNFYILDPQANRLLRYLPAVDGYSAPPENYFPQDQPVNLSNAVDFAIDGAIYILFADGRIAKYQAGAPVEFNISGLVKPLSNPVAIFAAPDEEAQYVYVADAGNQRIVQLEKNGGFVRQFKPALNTATTFANLQDIYVDEIGGRLYILEGNSLYATNLPSAGAVNPSEAAVEE